MNNLGAEQQKNRKIYRELFSKANADLKKLITAYKAKHLCKKDGICKKIRYSDLSPADIYVLNQREKVISEEYIKLMLPYGSDENFDYENNNYIDIEINNTKAREAASGYVDLIISKSQEPVYFYYFKDLENDLKKSNLFSNFPHSITTILPNDCIYRIWQEEVLLKFKKEVTRDIYVKLKTIDAYRTEFECKKTGTCCKLACSEFSYEELKIRAQNGDAFAAQFTSVFIPYENKEDARKIYPEYYDLVHEQIDDDEEIHFYYCPHLNEDNLCTQYENRPQVCRDFPNNPLSILPPTCGFYQWKDEVHIESMLLHALIMISEFYIEKLEALLSD